jgi:hypothetical protein
MTTETEKAIADREKARRADARKRVRHGERAEFDLDEFAAKPLAKLEKKKP